MKKTTKFNFSSKGIFLGFSLLLAGAYAHGQCLTDNYGEYPTGSLTLPTCDLTVYSVDGAGYCYSAEYSTISVVSGNTYTFSSSIPTDLITIGTDDGATALTFGFHTINWVATLTGDVRFYTHADALCTDDGEERSRFVRCGVPPPPPANNECSGAVFITGTTSGNTISATQSIPSSTCNSYTSSYANDIWYSLSPSTSGNLDITIDETNLDAVWEAYSGTCGSLTSLGCEDIGPTLTIPVVAGQTYYFRVYGYGGVDGNFVINITGTNLPVSLGNLNGSLVEGNKARLNWISRSELNNKGFEIQRSADGRSFSNIGFVSSSANDGNSSGTLVYTYTDNEPLTGSAYYRLQQVDKDGKVTFSNIVRLSATENGGTLDIVAVPNPVINAVTINTYGKPAANAYINITDISGKVIRKVAIKGVETVIDMSSLTQGIYFVQYRDDIQSKTIKISKN